jgi:eukaryotic-like serine/threonine-protein kinase
MASSRAVNTAPPASSDALPRGFAGHQLFERIGRGGMADIFLARRSALGAEHLVVIKRIHDALAKNATFSRMFVEEAKLCAGLRHANIVQVLDLGRQDDSLFMTMEYVEGYDLNRLLGMASKKKVALPLEFAIHIVREVLAALDFAHRAKDAEGHDLGIVHRDVSPSNVLVSFEGEVKLCDFGIARAFARPEQSGTHAVDEMSALRDAMVIGKSAYMSPEQAHGDALDRRSDIFAAGILLWELCSGRRLYRGTEAEMLAQAREARIPRLERDLPAREKLQAVLDRALAFERRDRWASARDFREALDDYALDARLMASSIRFGEFLVEHFGLDEIQARRAKQRAARAIDLGPLVKLEILPGLSEATPTGAAARRSVESSAPVVIAASPDWPSHRLRAVLVGVLVLAAWALAFALWAKS